MKKLKEQRKEIVSLIDAMNISIVVFIVVVAFPNISWRSPPLIFQRSQSRFPFLDGLCFFQKLFAQTSVGGNRVVP